MATAHVDRNLFGLVIVVPAGHPAVALLNRLPRSLCLRPYGSTGEYIVGLTAEVLPSMRQLFKLADTEFSTAAVDALATLSKQQRRAPQRQTVEVTPDVSPSLRALEATTDPFVSGATGAGSQQMTQAPSCESTP